MSSHTPGEDQSFMTRPHAFCPPLVLSCRSLLLLAGIAAAQPAVTTLAGRVTDPQSAPAPGATVTVHRVETATTWTLASDADGRFSFPGLPPGMYNVDVQLSGFAPWRADSITLRV